MANLQPIQGYPNYFINTDCKVWSAKRKIFMRYRLRKGYACVWLSHKGKQNLIGIHRLMALAYIPNPKNEATVNHIDGNKLNNSIENLEWLSASDNLKHAHRTGLNHISEKCIKNGLEAAKKLVLNTETGIYYDSAKEAAQIIGVNHNYLQGKLNGKYRNNTPFIYC